MVICQHILRTELFKICWKSSEKSKKIVYLPIYMTMFIDKTQLGADLIYKLDIDSLNKYVGA